jgi:hypothetical protein
MRSSRGSRSVSLRRAAVVSRCFLLAEAVVASLSYSRSYPRYRLCYPVVFGGAPFVGEGVLTNLSFSGCSVLVRSGGVVRESCAGECAPAGSGASTDHRTRHDQMGAGPSVRRGVCSSAGGGQETAQQQATNRTNSPAEVPLRETRRAGIPRVDLLDRRFCVTRCLSFGGVPRSCFPRINLPRPIPVVVDSRIICIPDLCREGVGFVCDLVYCCSGLLECNRRC